MAIDSSQFNANAQNILKDLQELLNKEDEEILSVLPPLCKNFLIFYRNYYEGGERTKNGLKAHQIKIKSLINPDDKSSYGQQKENESVFEIVTSSINATRKLESLLTGFKTIFLKTLGQTFIQQIVIETDDFKPEIIQLEGFSGMEPFIEKSLSNFQGKLKSNAQMLDFINNNNNHNNLYTKIPVKEPYTEIYSETRRRLNIFYDKVKKGQHSGEGLLLYKPSARWKKFYIITLGDVKEGYISMVSAQAPISSNTESAIQNFAENYIGKVDNIAGSLLQDIQNIEKQLQISSKSGSAQTGSHRQLIEIIEKVASGNLEIIRETFQKDKVKSDAESGQRNRIYNNQKSKEKIATIINKASEKKAEQAVDITVEDLQKAGNVLVQIQKSVINNKS